MKNFIRNDKGLTLVEILAAIVILSIVLITFTNFLFQSTKYTKLNKEKITAIEVAEEVISEVRDGIYQQNIEFDKNGYKIKIEIDKSNVPINLYKAIVTVKSKSEVGINGSPFITEMYFEATP